MGATKQDEELTLLLTKLYTIQGEWIDSERYVPKE